MAPMYRLPVEVWATLRRLEREIPQGGAYGAADMIDDYAYLGTPE